MDPSSAPEPDFGSQSRQGARMHAAHVDHVDLDPSGPLRASRLRQIAIVTTAIAVLIGVTSSWVPAGAGTMKFDVITDYEPADAGVAAAAPAPQVTTAGTVDMTTSTLPTSTSPTRAAAGLADRPDATVESTTTAPPGTVEPVPAAPAVAPPVGIDPALVGRPIPSESVASMPPVTSPWADKSRVTAAGYVATDVGCASGTSAKALDAFFSQRVGPVIGHDYQHVYPLGGDRSLWLFQDTFIDYSGAATNLGQAAFAHNTAMVQDGACFTLYHRGTVASARSFENGTGESRLAKWFWPMGGQTFDGKLYVFWAEMQKDGYEPSPPNGLGWHPTRTWLAVYDATTLARLSFATAPNSGVAPIYGYAVDSDAEYTYLFGNTFEQNLQREGGYFNGPHSGTTMWLARMPVGQFGSPLEYRTADGWSFDADAAQPISQRYWAENPMQARYLAGQWVAVTKINGYWGESLSVDVANDPWGPWTTVESRVLSPRGGDPLMNTYHAYLMPWLEGGSLVVSISQNARNMLRDAWPDPARYRLAFFGATLVVPPPRDDLVVETTVPETSTTVPETSTTVPETSTTVPETSTTVAETTTTTSSTSSTSTTTTTTSPATTTTSPATTTTSTVEPTTTTSSTSTTSTTSLPTSTTSTSATTIAG